MNVFKRLDSWWEGRKKVTQLEIKIYNAIISEQLKNIEASAKNNPQLIMKEFALIKARLDQMELYVGLKREPKPEHVPGAAKIS